MYRVFYIDSVTNNTTCTEVISFEHALSFSGWLAGGGQRCTVVKES